MSLFVCSNCGKRIQLGEFCVGCKAAYHKKRYLLKKQEISEQKQAFYKKNKQAISKRTKEYRKTQLGQRARWAQHLRRHYSMSIEDWARMYNNQNRSCATCCDFIDTESAAVDHNHETGTVRGLLCRSCNLAIGHVKESTHTLSNMIRYLTT